MDKPKIVRNKILITSGEVSLYGASHIDNRIENCKNDAVNVAKAQGYKNPKVVQEVFLPEYNPMNEDGCYVIVKGWRNSVLPCVYAVTVEDVEII